MKKTTFDIPFDVIVMSEALGKSLKIARKRRGMTQREVALRIGSTREVVLNAEKGKSITSYNLFAILWLYGLLYQAIDAVSDDKDVIGMSHEKSRLPQRVREKKSDNDF